MDRLAVVALMGGFFAILTFIHFAIDWIFQSHAEAMVKHNNPKVRAKHCLIYTSPFVLFLWWCGLSPAMIGLAAFILFFSHFIEDTYWPVFLWVKYVRKPPEMQWRLKENGGKLFLENRSKGVYVGPYPQFNDSHITWGLPTNAPAKAAYFKRGSERQTLNYPLSDYQKALDTEYFGSFISTPLGKILMIAVDQIIHIAFLLPIAYLIVVK